MNTNQSAVVLPTADELIEVAAGVPACLQTLFPLPQINRPHAQRHVATLDEFS